MRLVVAGAMLLLWIPMYRYMHAGPVVDTHIAEVAGILQDPDLVWSREDLYYLTTARSRTSMAQTNQVAPLQYGNEHRIRVLLYGDSYVFGLGLRDIDRRIGESLERALDARTAPGTFEVVSLAWPNRSVFDHAAWALAIARGALPEQAMGTLDPRLSTPFDAIVLGVVENDVVPSGGAEVPIALQRLVGADAPTSYTAVDEYDVTYKGADNPNLRYVTPAATILANTVAPGPAIFAPLAINNTAKDVIDAFAPLYEAAGFVVADDPHADALRAAHGGAALMVTGVDAHPGVALHTAYAEDVADALLTHIAKDRLATAMATARAVDRGLVSNFIPTYLQLDDIVGGVSLRSLGDVPDVPCDEYGANGSFIVCDADGTTHAVLHGAVAGGEQLQEPYRTAPQQVPCAPLGRPFAQVMFDPTLPDGTEIAVRIATKGARFGVYLVSYDVDGFERIYPVGTYSSGEVVVRTGTYTATVPSVWEAPGRASAPPPVAPSTVSVRGVALRWEDGPSCDVHDASVLSFPAAEISFVRRGA